MRVFLCILAALTVTGLSEFLQAQAPHSLNYQAVARDANGNVLASQSIDMRMTILNGATTLYQETHNDSTTNHGLINLVIGDGTPVNGTFADIDWSLGQYDVKVELDIGSGYVDMGTSPLESVPYALYANSADTAKVALTAENVFWKSGPTTSISYTDTATAGDGWVVGVNRFKDPVAGQHMLRLTTPANPANDFQFIHMRSGKFASDEVASIGGDGVASFSGMNATDTIGDNGTAPPGGFYADNAPMAWGHVGSSGYIYNSYGVDSIIVTGTQYEIYLTNAFKGYPVVLTQTIGGTANKMYFMRTTAIPIDSNTNKIKLLGYEWSQVNGTTATTNPFMFVVFGRPQ